MSRGDRPTDDPFKELLVGFTELVEHLADLSDEADQRVERGFTVRNINPDGKVRFTDDDFRSQDTSRRPQPTSGPEDQTSDDDDDNDADWSQLVGGLGSQLGRIREMVELPLRRPELFRQLGITPPKGVLLHGPPGCGKTLIARTLAKQAGVKFFAVSGPEILNKYYGESEARLRQLFEQARRDAPALVFIDEIDALAPKRDQVYGELEKRVVAQLLTVLDGLDTRGEIILIGATNRPNALDPALRRPGRFDREIEIPVPDREGRRQILAIHTRTMPLQDESQLEQLADRTHGFVGADLQALCQEAALQCLRRSLQSQAVEDLDPAQLKIEWEDFAAAFQEVEPSALREMIVEVPNVKWEDVGGLGDVKDKLVEAVEWPLRHGHLFAQAGLRPSRGILLVGPPGCGKTLLAKALATESQANFLAIKGADLLSKYIGESEQRLRDVFRRARQAAPCILFFDELDTLLPGRTQVSPDSAVTERVLAQFLVEMDGIEELKGVLVLGATNRVDRLDEAILRPGRFDEIVQFTSPKQADRAAILRIHLRNKPVSPEVDPIYLASLTEGWSGAELSAACNRAALLAVRRAVHGDQKKMAPLTQEDVLQAMQQVRG